MPVAGHVRKDQNEGVKGGRRVKSPLCIEYNVAKCSLKRDKKINIMPMHCHKTVQFHVFPANFHSPHVEV